MKIFGTKTINCNKHKHSSITHFCTDNKCNNNPLLCTQCFIDDINRTYHNDHEKRIIPLEEGIQTVSEQIKAQTVPMQKVYNSTIGKSQYFLNLFDQIQKGEVLYKELDDRINSIKNQINIEIGSFMKQLQREILIEKTQFFKILDQYQKSYIKNIDFLKQNSQSILNFNKSIKYYANKNSLYLKLVAQTKKKSDWIIKTKNIIQNSYKYSLSSMYSNQISNILATANRINIDSWPSWKIEQNSKQRIKQTKLFFQKIFNQWVSIPEIKSLEEEIHKVNSILIGNRHPSVKEHHREKNIDLKIT